MGWLGGEMSYALVYRYMSSATETVIALGFVNDAWVVVAVAVDVLVPLT